MKAKIKGIEVEGSVEEMRELLGLVTVPSATVGKVESASKRKNGKIKVVIPVNNPGKKIGTKQQRIFLAELFVKNPTLKTADIGAVMDAYKERYGRINSDARFERNVKRVIKKSLFSYKKSPIRKRASSKGRHGNMSKDIASILKEKPSLLKSSTGDIYSEYCKLRSLPAGNYSGTFSTHVNNAKNLAMKSHGSSYSKPEPTERVRYFHWGISLPYVLKIVQERMPETFGIKDVMRAVLTNLRMSVEPSHSKYISLQASLPKYLRMLVEKGYLTGKKVNASWVFTKVAQPVQPVRQSSGISSPSVSLKAPAIAVESYHVPIITKETLDNIVQTYVGISPESLIGLLTKNGKVVTSNDARYLFKNLMENIGGLQRLYPGKKFTIAGQGQWKSIDIR